MSVFIDLDSVWRDRDMYPNPMDYQLTAKDVETWARSGRTVRAVPQNPNERPVEFCCSIEIKSATLPYPRIELFASAFVVVDAIDAGAVMSTVDPHGLLIGDVVTTSTTFGINGIRRNVQYWVVATPTPTTFQVSLTQGGPVFSGFTAGGPGLNISLSVITPAEYADVMAQLEQALQLLSYPRIYLDFHCSSYNDPQLIRGMCGRLSDAKFILLQERIQLDDRQTPIWIHYICRFEQVMRFKRDDPVSVRFFTRDCSTITCFTDTLPDFPDPCEDEHQEHNHLCCCRRCCRFPTNPFKQSLLTFEIKPYLRDASFVHHSVDPKE